MDKLSVALTEVEEQLIELKQRPLPVQLPVKDDVKPMANPDDKDDLSTPSRTTSHGGSQVKILDKLSIDISSRMLLPCPMPPMVAATVLLNVVAGPTIFLAASAKGTGMPGMSNRKVATSNNELHWVRSLVKRDKQSSSNRDGGQNKERCSVSAQQRQITKEKRDDGHAVTATQHVRYGAAW